MNIEKEIKRFENEMRNRMTALEGRISGQIATLRMRIESELTEKASVKDMRTAEEIAWERLKQVAKAIGWEERKV